MEVSSSRFIEISPKVYGWAYSMLEIMGMTFREAIACAYLRNSCGSVTSPIHQAHMKETAIVHVALLKTWTG